jgi:hypothetical protein
MEICVYIYNQELSKCFLGFDANPCVINPKSYNRGYEVLLLEVSLQ